MTHRLAVYALVVSLFSGTALGGGRQGDQIFITFPAPASVEELAAQADAVIRCRVLTSQTIAGKRPFPRVYTEHRVRILETIAGWVPAEFGEPHDEILVLQHAGEVETENGTLGIADEVPLAPDSEYVLFLQWHPTFERHEIWLGRYCVYKIEKDTVHPASNFRTIVSAKGKNVRRFAEELRRARREREKKQ